MIMGIPVDEAACEHNKRWSEECGRDLTCSSCGVTWKEEIWRENDGPCKDGKFHCIGCLINGKCGCGGRTYTQKEAETSWPPAMPFITSSNALGGTG